MARNRTTRPTATVDPRDVEIARLRADLELRDADLAEARELSELRGVEIVRLRAENAELRARIEAGKEALLENDDPRAALRAAGITTKGGQGRRFDAAALAKLYVRFLENPPAAVSRRRSTAATLKEEARSYKEFARFLKGGPPPAVWVVDGHDVVPDFVPDPAGPMSPSDAIRNLAAYTGQSERAAWEMLKRERRDQVGRGEPGFTLPRRPRR